CTSLSPTGRSSDLARGRNAMVDHSSRLEDELAAGPPLARSDAELGLRATQRSLREGRPADARGKSTCDVEQLSATGSVAAQQVADDARIASDESTPDNPVEFPGPPPRSLSRPTRECEPADPEDVAICEWTCQRLQPAGLCDGIVVQKGHDVALCERHAGVLPAGKTACM